jgi:hypothetical protein
MKKSTAKRSKTKSVKKPALEAPIRTESTTLQWLGETCTLVPFMEKSYVLSRFWAWFSRIEMSPQLRIPVPRFLTYRDP